MTIWKRVISCMLVFALCISCLSGVAYAAVGTEISIECETATPITNSSSTYSGTYESRTDSSASGGKFYFMQANAVGSWIQFTFSVEEDGVYQFYLRSKDDTNRAKVQLALENGTVNVGGEVDLYRSAAGYVEHDVGSAELKAGTHTIRITATGKNSSASTRYGVAADRIRLVKTAELPAEAEETILVPLSSATLSEGWVDSSLADSEGNAGASKYATTTDVTATYTYEAEKAGYYCLSRWNPRETSVMEAAVTAGQSGETRLRLPAASAACWQDIGTYYLAQGETISLSLKSIDANTVCVADIKLERYSAYEDPSVVWDNDDTDSGYVVNGDGWKDAESVTGNGGTVQVTSTAGETCSWGAYPPATGNYHVFYYNPVAEGDRQTLKTAISTQDGNWRGSITLEEAEQGHWVRLATVTATEGTAFSVSITGDGEGELYADAIRIVPTTAAADAVYTPGSGGSTEPALIVNQIGYDIGKTKRATAPNFDDGAQVKLLDLSDAGKVVWSGTVQGNVVDFSEFEPAVEDHDYQLSCGDEVSFTFKIGTDLIYRNSVEQALDFMIETRQDYVVGNSTGYAWRDSHQFSFELNSLVLQYMANPALYDSMTGGITDAAKCVYEELQTQGADEPDIVWLMKFGALRYYDLGANDGVSLHMLIKEQLAYFLYIYPYISKWVDEDFYTQVRDFTLKEWSNYKCTKQWYQLSGSNHNLFNTQTVFGGLKGQQPPGHSIVPNLMMYEVVKRDGLGEEYAEKFFTAAYNNCEYTLNNLDINNPYYAKGQRMSEHITMPALAYFQEMYPDRAPEGLLDAIRSWANVNVARADNMWDMRKAVSLEAGDGQYTFSNGSAITQDYWTGAAYALADGQNPAPKNEPGNIAGVQAITLAAARVLDETADAELIADLELMGVSAIDDLYGRNPTGRAAFYHFTRDFEGGDLGWYKQHIGGYGKLEGCTAVIDANTPESCYPYAPENYNTGYTEGWVAYNTAWNDSLAYSSADNTILKTDITEGNGGNKVTVTLEAPINMDTESTETAYVWVTDMSGNAQALELTEQGVNTRVFQGEYTLSNSTDYVVVSYGIGLFEQSITVDVLDFVPVLAESITVEGENTVSAGRTLELSAVVSPETTTNKKVIWSSSDETVATVSATGVVKALKEGTVTIKAQSWEVSTVYAEKEITVTPALLESVVLVLPYDMGVNTEAQAVVTGTLEDGNSADLSEATMTYSTTTDTLVKVSETGLVTALAEGSAVVVVDVTLNGVTKQATAEVNVGNAVVATTTWQCEEMSPASTATGFVANSNGLVLLKPTADEVSAQTSFVTFTTPEIAAGTYQLQIRMKTYTNYGVFSAYLDEELIASDVDGLGSNQGAFVISELGEFTVDSAGTHTIKLLVTGKNSSSSGYNQAFDYFVLNTMGTPEPPAVQSVSVDPASVTVEIGNTQQFVATVTGTNNPLKTVTWSVSGAVSESTKISATGLLTVAADETAEKLTVTAVSDLDNEKYGTANVTVDKPMEVSITAIEREGSKVTVTGTSKNLGQKKVEIIVDADLDQRYVAQTLDGDGNWKCEFELEFNGDYEIEASIRDYSDFNKIIQKVPEDNYYEVDGRVVWGTTVAQGPDGLYYMIFSTWYNTQGFSKDWPIYSELGYATSTSPDGPFVYQGMALDAAYSNTTNESPVYWEGVGNLEVFHNPTMIHSEKDGKYYLYFMGTNATEGNYTYSYGRNHQRIGVAYADTPAGPWTVAEEPLIDVREGMYDSLLVSNPSVTEVKNADGTYTYYTVYKAVSNLSGSDVVVSGCGKSNSPLGPFERSEEAIMRNPTDGWSVEDCFVWSNEGKLYALAKDFKSYFTGVEGYSFSYALFESTDGYDWGVSEHALAFVTEVPWETGEQQVTNLERAQLYLCDGIPFLLCAATTKNGGSPYSGNAPINVQIPLLGVMRCSDTKNITVEDLTEKTLDLSKLESAVESGEAAQKNCFTNEDWGKLSNALRAAQIIGEDASATQADVDFYVAELEKALALEMDPSEVLTNIVLNKPVTGTNTYTQTAAGVATDAYLAAKAVDGDGTTRWATKVANTESVLTADLEGFYRMDSFRIAQFQQSSDGITSRINSFVIEVYDGENWTEAFSGTGTAAAISGTFDSPVYGQEVRLVLKDDASIAPSIFEFEVYGVAHEHNYDDEGKCECGLILQDDSDLLEEAQAAAQAAQAAAEAADAAKNAAQQAEADAVTAKEAAETAKADAQVAKAAAEEAQNKAEEAKAAAEEAAASVGEDSVAAEAAKTAAETAKALAEAAQAKAEQAEKDAQTAQENAETAEVNAETAQTKAEEAQVKAEAAAKAAEESDVEAAKEAAKAAEEAEKAATEAGKSAAESAKAAEAAGNAAASAAAAAKSAEESAGYANSAAQSSKEAQLAQKAAEEAKAAAEAAKIAAEEEKAAAESAKDDAQAAKQAAEAAEAAAQAAQEAAEAEKAAAESAKQAAEDAKAAAEAAQKAAEDDQLNAEAAQKAAEAAQAAAEAAQVAAEKEKQAAEAAQKAAKEAEERAQTALAAAEAAKLAAEEEKLAAEAAQKAAEEEKLAAEQAQAAAEEAKKAAEEAALDGVKQLAVCNLDNYVQKLDQSGYLKEQINALAEIVSEAKTAISDAENMDEVQEILDNAKAEIDTIDDMCPSKDYADVEAEGWYHEYLDYMIENGYMKGVSESKFDVNGTVTRAQLVTILYRIAGEPSVEGMDNPFADIAEDQWYTDAVIWAANLGVVKGVSETSFAPNAEINREQIVTILYRYSGEQRVEKDHLSGYSDVDSISAYAMDAMNWAVGNELIKGVSDTVLDSKSNATRAQICAIVMRYCEN